VQSSQPTGWSRPDEWRVLERLPESWARRAKRLIELKIISQITGFELDAAREIRNKATGEGAYVSRLDGEASIKMFVAALSSVFAAKA
jgi:hypothetical protein